MNTQVDRAVALLFPATGRRALDVKFLFGAGATVETLAEQTIVCLASMDDNSCMITDVDQGLTA